MFDPHSFHSPFHIGLRIFKTGLASFICLVFSHALGGYAFFAVIAALICMRPTIEDSLKVGINRVVGTIIGGFSGMILLWIMSHLGWSMDDFIYQLIIILGMMLLIKFISSAGHSPATIITCVVYASILMLPVSQGHTIFQYSMMRVLDTLLGVVVALMVIELLPHHRLKDFREKEKALLEAEAFLKATEDKVLKEEEKEKLAKELKDIDAHHCKNYNENK